MAIQRQLRRGNKSQIDVFTGAIGETVYETENKRLFNHDGSQAGGFPVPNYLDLQSRYFTTGDAVQDTSGDYVLTLPYAPISYVENQVFTIVPDSNNLGACDININGLGLKDIQKFDADGVLEELEADDLKANVPADIYYTGVRFVLKQNGSGGGVLELVATASPATVSSVEFDGVYDLDYTYEIYFSNVTPSTDGVVFRCRFSDDGGATYETTGYDGASMFTSGGSPGGASYTTSVQMSGSIGSAGSESITGMLTIFNPIDSSEPTDFIFNTTYRSSAATQTHFSGGGRHTPSVAINGVQFAFSSGNIESGLIALYRRKMS
jgi:hypothetical protein